MDITSTPIMIGIVIIVLGAVIASIYLKNSLSTSNGVTKDEITSKNREDLKFINPQINEKANELKKEKSVKLNLVNPVKQFSTHKKREEQFDTVLIEQNLKSIENSVESEPTEPTVTKPSEPTEPTVTKPSEPTVTAPPSEELRISEMKNRCMKKIKQISNIQRVKYVA